jgi:hypothetical protein
MLRYDNSLTRLRLIDNGAIFDATVRILIEIWHTLDVIRINLTSTTSPVTLTLSQQREFRHLTLEAAYLSRRFLWKRRRQSRLLQWIIERDHPDFPTNITWVQRVACGIERGFCVLYGLTRGEKRLLKECLELRRVIRDFAGMLNMDGSEA